MSDWNVGDVVVLKSGGPRMTVSTAVEEGNVVCTWFDKEDQPHSEAFPAEGLAVPRAPGLR